MRFGAVRPAARWVSPALAAALLAVFLAVPAGGAEVMVLPATVQAQQTPSELLDAGFGTNGVVTTNIATHTLDSANAMALDSSGRLVVAGSSDGHFALVRYTAAGALDTSFGSDGVVITDVATPAFPNRDDGAFALALQSDGKIVAAGGADGDFAVVRYSAAGVLDTSFSGDGMVVTDIGSDSLDVANALALQSDGKIVAAGVSAPNVLESDFALVRYTAAGALDTSFDSDGKVTTNVSINFGSDSLDVANALALQSDGKIVAAGDASGDFAVVRYSAAGALDTSFDSDGKVTTGFGSDSFDVANALAVQSDGKIVAAGGADGEFALVRYSAAGALDTSFSGDGKVTTGFGSGSFDVAIALALQSDGKIVAAGGADGDFALVRYSAAGALDTSFSGDGKVTTDTSTDGLVLRFQFGESGKLIFVSETAARAVVVDSSGRLVVAGGADGDFALVRYSSAGALDTDFDGDGKVTTDVGASGRDRGWGVALQSDGKIVVAAETTVSNLGSDFAVLRYSSAGVLDTAFDSDGIVTTDAFATGTTNAVENYRADRARVVAVQSDNKIVAAGAVATVRGVPLGVARYDISGALDTAFDSDGFVVTEGPAPRVNFAVEALALQSDGKIVAAGTAVGISAEHDFGVMRLTAAGALDTSFDTDGKVGVDVDGRTDRGAAMALQSDGKIVVAGQANDYFAVIRLTAAGALDTSFDTDGKVTGEFSSSGDTVAAVALQSDGKIVVAGTSGDDFAVARLTAAGALDTTFSSDGKVTVDIGSGSADRARAMVLDSDGKIVVAGISDEDFAVVRLTAAGALDTDFDGDGKALLGVGSRRADVGGMALQPDGKIVLVGTRDSDAAGRADTDVVVIRLAPVPPGAPTMVTAQAGDTTAAVSWAEPVDKGGGDITGYTATSDPGSFTCTVTGAISCTVNGLTNGTAYTFTVVATNAYGASEASAPSAAVTPGTLPGAPTAVMAQHGEDSAVVSWTAPTDNGGADISAYTVTASPGGETCPTTGALTCTFSSLTTGTAYTFTVTATNSEGRTSEASAASASLTVQGQPQPPAAVTAQGGEDSAVVSWAVPIDNGGGDITSYTATSDPGGFTCTTAGALTCTISSLTTGTPYTFTVTATNSGGFTSAASEPSPSVAPGGAPGAPSEVSATSKFGALRVVWSAPTDEGTSPVNRYRATALAVDAATSPQRATCTVAATSSGTRTCTIEGLGRRAEYTVTVTAANTSGGVGQSSAPSAPVRTIGQPDPPTMVSAQPLNTGAVVSWNAPEDNGGAPISRYQVYSLPESKYCTSDGATSCTVTGLTNGIGHTFTVFAYNRWAGSTRSEPSSSITSTSEDPDPEQPEQPEQPDQPGPPTAVQATAGDRSAVVSWAAPVETGGSAISGYTATASPGGATCTTTGATSCTVTGLSNDTAYTFTVTATNSEGRTSAASAASAPVTPGATQLPTTQPPTTQPPTTQPPTTQPPTTQPPTTQPPTTQLPTTQPPEGDDGEGDDGEGDDGEGDDGEGDDGEGDDGEGDDGEGDDGEGDDGEGDDGEGDDGEGDDGEGDDGEGDDGEGDDGEGDDGEGDDGEGDDGEGDDGEGDDGGDPDGQDPDDGDGGDPAEVFDAAEVFNDVDADDYFAAAVSWLLQHDITTGCADDAFCPSRPVTRQEFVTLLWRAAGQPEPQQRGSETFSDIASGHYSDDAVGWASQHGITTGCFSDNETRQFCGDRSASRAEVSTLLYRYIQAGQTQQPPATTRFSDVDPNAYYAPAVNWMDTHQITTGCDDDAFCPHDTTSRAQVAAFMHRIAANPQSWAQPNQGILRPPPPN